jgi:hypothetical protein
MESLVNHINSLPITKIKSDDFTKETIFASLTGLDMSPPVPRSLWSMGNGGVEKGIVGG